MYKRQSLYNKASSHLGYKSCWTTEGRIFAKVDDHFIEINSENDIPGLLVEPPINTMKDLLDSLGADLDTTM